jgi:hypothetical protein
MMGLSRFGLSNPWLSCLFLVLVSSAPLLNGQTPNSSEGVTATPDRIDFGSHDITTRTSAVAVAVRNHAKSSLKFSATLDNRSDYRIDNNECLRDIGPEALCVIGVTFSPTGIGEREGTLQVGYGLGSDGKASKVLSVRLTGRGFLPDLVVSPAEVRFPPQNPGTTSRPETVTLMNTSQKEVTISGVASSGAFLVDALPVSQTLKPGGTLVLAARFSPKTAGDVAGTLAILSNSTANPKDVYLSGSTSCGSIGPCSSSVRLEVLIVIAFCLLYWLTVVIGRWHRIARPTRELLRAEISSLQVELGTLAAGPTAGGSDLQNIATLLQAAKDLTDESKPESGRLIANFLFWSRGQEIAGWGYVHEVEIQMVDVLSDDVVTARLETAERELRMANDASSLALANTVHQALTSSPITSLARRQALLKEALNVIYDRKDSSFAVLVSWQNKTAWLIGCGLLFTIVLTIAIEHHAVLFLLGAVGGLLSRMSRSLDRKDVPTDYGASWTTLFLSPVAGALGAWAGILISALAVNLNVLGSAFKTDWNDPYQPLTLSIALVFGFSERLLDGVLDKLVEKTGTNQSATNPQPPQKTTGGAPTPPDSGQANNATRTMPFAISTDPKLADGKVGTNYSVQLQAVGSGVNLSWLLVDGVLPPGLYLASNGVIGGQPAAAGTFTFRVAASDKASQQYKTFTIVVSPAG